jgi:hypothetical protein
MTPDIDGINRLLAEKQSFFLPYYRDVVATRPHGIAAANAKTLVAQRIQEDIGADVFDPAFSGLNATTGLSYANQWANNLVSNHILDDYMLVVRDTRATLYPGTPDNSRTQLKPTEELTPGQLAELNERAPTTIEVSVGVTYRRSLQLAEHVREMSGRACAVASLVCDVFDARDGRAYVEVHHVVPMAMQSQLNINLDRTTNMVPLCPRCHTCLHRGHLEQASVVLNELLHWYESVHGRSFEFDNGDLGLNLTCTGLLEMYG